MFDSEEEEYRDSAFYDDLERFETMIKKGSSEFFDSDRLEMMLDHFIMNNQYRKALACVDHALYHFPMNITFKVRKAQVLSGGGKLNEALNLLLEVERFVQEDQEYLLTRASVHSQLRDSKSAVRYFEKALAQSSGEERDEIYVDLSFEYQALDDYDSAIRILTEAVSENPENESAVYELAYCFDQKGDIEEAVKCYEVYLDFNPYSFTTWYNLGNAYSKAENYEKAAWAYDYSILINDNFTSAYFNLANAYVSLNKFRMAIECFEKCLELDGEDAVIVNYIAEAYEQLEEYDLALHYYRLSRELSPELPEPWLGTGIVLDLQGKENEAIHFIRKAVELEPNNQDYLHVLGGCELKVGDLEAAEVAYSKGLSLDPSNEDLLIDYIKLVAVNDLETGVEQLEQFISENQLEGVSKLLLVKLYWMVGKQSDALLLFKDLVFLRPNVAKKLFLHFEEAEMIPQFIQLYELIEEK